MTREHDFEERLGELARELADGFQSYALDTTDEDHQHDFLGEGVKSSHYRLWVISEDMPHLFHEYLRMQGMAPELIGPKWNADGDRYTLLFDREISTNLENYPINRVDITIDRSKRLSRFSAMGSRERYGAIKGAVSGFFDRVRDSMEKYSG